MSEPLQEKYRPKCFEDLRGNEDTVTGLKTVCRREKGPPPAILLIGPRGCGKTTLAYIIKNELKVDDREFVELNSADDRGIDAVRNLRRNTQFAPLSGAKRIYFLDECHKLTNDAQNAMLKLLEKPPSHVTFILATTDPQMLLETFRSRCAIYQVATLSSKDLRGLIKAVLDKEKVKNFPEEAIGEIASIADGSPREALVLLDAVIDIEDDRDLMNALQGYRVSEATTKELCQALLNGTSWKEVGKIIKAIDDEPEKVRYAVLGYMSAVLLNGDNARAALVIECFAQSFMYSRKAGLTLAAYLIATAPGAAKKR